MKIKSKKRLNASKKQIKSAASNVQFIILNGKKYRVFQIEANDSFAASAKDIERTCNE